MNDEFTYGNRHSRPGFGCWKNKATASELKEKAFFPQTSDKDGNLIGTYMFDPDEIEIFIDQVCKEQREKCADNCTNAINTINVLNTVKPDGL